MPDSQRPTLGSAAELLRDMARGAVRFDPESVGFALVTADFLSSEQARIAGIEAENSYLRYSADALQQQIEKIEAVLELMPEYTPEQFESDDAARLYYRMACASFVARLRALRGDTEVAP